VVVLDEDQTTNVIAETKKVDGGGQYRLHAVEAGFPQGSLRTITVTLTASGLAPGAHAVHIHVGSCQSQGPVAYMLMDFNADANGNINHQTRAVTGVTVTELTGGWYLNLHQGNSNNILSNGQPTINFRPLLCANI
jgi:CHRD domain-containing protein